MKKDIFNIKLNQMLLFMYIICLATVIWISDFIKISTNKVILDFGAREFISKISALPGNTNITFIKVIFYSLMLGITFLIRIKMKRADIRIVIATLVLDFMMCIRVIVLLDFNYNGVLLWVFTNLLIYLLKNKFSPIILIFGMLSYILTDKNLISMWIKAYNVSEFISIYSKERQTYLYLLYNILNMTTMLVFFICCIFIIEKKDETIKESNELYKKLAHANNDLKKVNKELEKMISENEKLAQIRERNRIAREIHDTMGHTITGIIAGIDACVTLSENSSEVLKKQLLLLSDLSRKAVDDIRVSVSSLRPDALEKISLNSALVELIENTKKIMGIDIEYICNDEHLNFDEDEENAVYRIIQESMTNATRHGKATKIKVVIEKRHGEIYLNISDNGIGCKELKEGFGIRHIRERIAMLNGNVSFKCNGGFEVEALVPIRWGENYD